MIEMFFPTMPDAMGFPWAWNALCDARYKFMQLRGFSVISVSAPYNKEDQTMKWSYKVDL